MDTSYEANIHFNNVNLGNTGFLENANGLQPFVGLFRIVIHMCIQCQVVRKKLCPVSYTNALSKCVTL